MLEKMRALLKENDLCVLATSSSDRPHCSLMSYITDEAGDTLFMATLKDSQKYRNLIDNPHVSLLVDSRGSQTQRSKHVQALTVSGLCTSVGSEQKKRALLDSLVRRHPKLKLLAERPDAEVLSIKVESFLLLDGVLESHFEKL